jgi:hypothetical protein
VERTRDRRRFDHLYEEICVALGRLLPRYALWLHMSEAGLDPDRLSRRNALAFCREDLDTFLFEYGEELRGRRARRLLRSVERFDPRRSTPYEHMSRLGAPDRPER